MTWRGRLVWSGSAGSSRVKQLSKVSASRSDGESTRGFYRAPAGLCVAVENGLDLLHGGLVIRVHQSFVERRTIGCLDRSADEIERLDDERW